MLQMPFPICEGIDHGLWTVCLLEHLSMFCNFVIYLKWFIFSRYWSFLDWRKDTSSGDELRFKRFLDSLIWNQPRPAHFFAYFHPRCLSILNLICCPPLLKEQVTQDLEKRGIAISNLADAWKLQKRYDPRARQSIRICIRRNIPIRGEGNGGFLS